MTEDIYNLIQQAAKAMAVQQGVLIEEDGILLNPKTIELVNEIEEANRQHAIDTVIDIALETGNRDLFMQLTN